MKALIIAKYLKSKTKEDKKHLRVQKLLYYSQGFYLAINNKPLFEDKIEAWSSGAIVPTVKENWSRVDDQDDISQDIKAFLDTVLKQFKEWKTTDLILQNQLDDPWLEVVESGTVEITLEIMHKFFKKKIVRD